MIILHVHVLVLLVMIGSGIEAKKQSAENPFLLNTGTENPFSIVLGAEKASVKVDLKNILPGQQNSEVSSNIQFDLFIGILHEKPKCVELITETPIPLVRDDGYYNLVPLHYDITKEQLHTLVDDNPLVIVKVGKTKGNEVKKFNDYNICGDTLLSSLDKENARVLKKEDILKPTVIPKGSPDARCSNGYIPFTNVPGIDEPYFRDIQTDPLLRRLGLSSLSKVNEVPQRYKIIPSSKERPLLGFGAHPSLQSLLIDPPKCDRSFLQAHLQTALELEWATLPLYLTGYYSIINGENQNISSIIHEIAIQEMLHFAQAGNLLIAVGGVPVINSSTAPSYPRRGLPGNVLRNLPISLTKLTKQQTYTTYMGVEIPNNSSAVNPPIINNLFTIGAFYNDVLACIEYLGESVFDNPKPNNQVQHDRFEQFGHGKLYVVTNVTTAKLAIEEIVAQGEGESPVSPDQIDSKGYAHFYKYEEVFCGKELQKKPGSSYYAYSGPPIPFNENGIYNMIDDPSLHIQPGTTCYNATKEFNNEYSFLVQKLEHAFQGYPSTIEDAIDQMNVVMEKANDVFTVPYKEGSQYTCGPVWNMNF